MTSLSETPDLTSRILSLAVGDLVIYGGHGIGRVAARENRAPRGEQYETVLLEFAEGLLVTLPIERALEYLRPLSSEEELACVARALRGDEPLSTAVWQKRLKATREKVIVGEAVGLAEVVRDGARRHRGPTASGGPRQISFSERQLYLKARRLLADEIGVSRGVEPSEADAWITRQLGNVGG